ncbi:MAG: tetratricopeptide repeat protein [Acidobacteriota bacterium]
MISNHFRDTVGGPEKAGVGGSIPSPATNPFNNLDSFYLAAMGRLDEAIAVERRAQRLDPVSLIVNTNIGRYLYYARRYDQAIEQSRATLDMDPSFFPARLVLLMSKKACTKRPLHNFKMP